MSPRGAALPLPALRLALLLVWVLSACAHAPPPPLVVKIGHAAPLSGRIAHLGRENENAVRLAIEEANAAAPTLQGRALRFELVGVDDGADPQRGRQVAAELVQAGVVAVVGHLNSGTSIPAAPIYAKAGVAMLTPSASNPQLTRLGLRNVFRLVPEDAQANRLWGQRWAAASGQRPIAVLNDGTAYGVGVASGFLEGLLLQGQLPVLGANQLAEPAEGLVQRVIASQAQAVYFGGMDTEAAPLLRALHAAGWRGELLGPDGICTLAFGKLAGSEVVQAHPVLCIEPGHNPPTAAYQAFAARFAQRYGVAVQVYAPQAYDAARLVIQAVLRSGRTGAQAVLAELARTQGYQGASGERIGFDARGELLEPGVARFRLQPGRRELQGFLP